MLKNILAVIILFTSAGLTIAQPAVQEYDYEITSQMLRWKNINKGNLAIRKLPAYKTWSDNFGANDQSARYAEVDLNGDGIKEIIVADSDFPAGGRGFLFLQKQSEKYVAIAYFRGGFVLARDDMKKYFNLHIYEKSGGDMHFIFLKYKQGKYDLFFNTKLPRTIYDEDFHVKWQELNTLSEQK